MRRSFGIAVVALCLLPLGGCGLLFGSVNKTFAEGNKGYAETVLPEYREYVKNDPALDGDDKRIRLQTADKWDALIADALKEE